MKPCSKLFVLHSPAPKDCRIAALIHESLYELGLDIHAMPAFSQRVVDWAKSVGMLIRKSDAVLLVWSETSSSCNYTQAALSLHCERPVIVLALRIGTSQDAIRIIRPEKTASCEVVTEEIVPKLLSELGIEAATKRSPENGQSNLAFFLSESEKQLAYLSILGEGEQIELEAVFQPIRFANDSEFRSGDHVTSVNDLVLGNSLQYAAMIGGPGTGKTTTLKYIAYRLIKQQGIKIPLYFRIPQVVDGGKSIEDEVKRKLKGIVFQSGLTEFTGHPNFLSESYILLFDAFDEVGEEKRNLFLTRLIEFKAEFPRCRIILASRPREFTTGSTAYALGDFRQLHVLPLSDDDILAYLRATKSHDAAHQAWGILAQDDRLLELVRTPFLLALISKFGIDHTMPSRERAQLFDRCVKYLLGVKCWERALGRPQNTREQAELMESALKNIALRFYKLDKDAEFTRQEILDVIEESTDTPEALLESILNQTGLLQNVSNKITFIHRSIWEYFVASAMLTEPVENLVERATSQKWEEPIRLHVGLRSADTVDNVLAQLWVKNKGLTLRAVSELELLPENMIRALSKDMPTTERLAILADIDALIGLAKDKYQQRRLLIDTLPPLLSVERDARVVFQALGLLESRRALVNDREHQRIRDRCLDLEHVRDRRERILNNPDFRCEFERIPSGEFCMGGNHPDRPQWMEGPIHNVRLSSFFMARYCVTNRLYYETGFPFLVDRRDTQFGGDNQPVANVTWFEAAMFAMWMGCRLRTEAEWEYSCRAGGKDDGILGDQTLLQGHAWYTANANNITHDVGIMTPNSFNLFDMLGNVREWCNDWCSNTYYSECLSHGTVIDPQGPASGTTRILRGGCFDWNALNLIPTYRNHKLPEETYFTNGFRLALSAS